MQADLWPIVAAPFVGSFLGVLILRLPAGAPVLLGRSRCPACAHTLSPLDLVPLASWLAMRGRCRYCAAPLARFYPAIELAALAVALSAWSATTGWLLWASCGLGWTLLALAVIDQREQLLPDTLTLPLIPVGLVVAYFDDPAGLLDHAIGAVAGYAVFVLVELVYARLRSRAGLGRGDAKLLAAAGAWVAWTGLPHVVLLAALAALAAAAVARLTGHAIHATTRIAFGPWLALGAWLVWLYGPLYL
jgi:leader peptidase (prepilin peptidase)/N-methyltransferase